MSMPQGEPRRGRGRPRTPGAEERILDAALQEYGEHGWSGFTMDGVARRAGVGKSTVYLRWQDKDSLLTDAVATHSGALGAVDTGSLRGDLEELSGNLFRHYLDSGGWASLRIIIDSAGAAKPLGQFVEAVTNVQVDFLERIVARACERGELSGDFSTNAIAEFVYGSVSMQMIGVRLEGRTLDEPEIRERAARLVTILLGGVLNWAGPGD
ncbi:MULTISPECIES: TetR/AcrR family transcriptional regulator [unclassified Nocardioides]|uniref:TetR/AcrR family transcriptional regulator n=1 Tax=unclassified Nocardioides TaxID=2615069 RepID=UPI000A26A9A6|nr:MULTISPECIES: TetR/AcrR family transcriptional regulator [unclassified Nocardioides]